MIQRHVDGLQERTERLAPHVADLEAIEARQKAAGPIEGEVSDQLLIAYAIHAAAAPGSHDLFVDFRRRWLLEHHSDRGTGESRQ